MSTRIVVCIDLDTDQLDTAYQQVYDAMGRTGLDWESSDEWFYSDGSEIPEQIPEFIISAVRVNAFAERKQPTRRPIDYVCEECGDSEIGVEAMVEFSPYQQDFIVHDTCDKGHWCSTCDGQCRLKEVDFYGKLDPAIAGDFASPRGSP
jgi:hypothetical protein